MYTFCQCSVIFSEQIHSRLKQLEIVFEEIDKMESDYEFMKIRMTNDICVGIFIIDTKEYKDVIMVEIKGKLNYAKKVLKDKFN